MADAKICKIDGCGKRVNARGMCSAHYERWRLKGDPMSGGEVKSHGDAMAWIKAHVRHDGDECLAWPFAGLGKGYGAIRFDGRSHPAHRVMCIEAHGEPLRGMHALHSCGNGHLGCVNPKHLRWGTAQDNRDDTMLHGTTCRKLTYDDVRAIRNDTRRLADIAREYGVSGTMIGNIRKGKAWVGLE